MTDAAQTRKPGAYWVRESEDSDWSIAFWGGFLDEPRRWLKRGETRVEPYVGGYEDSDEDLFEICEGRIEPPVNDGSMRIIGADEFERRTAGQDLTWTPIDTNATRGERIKGLREPEGARDEKP